MIGNQNSNGEKVKIKVPFCLKCNHEGGASSHNSERGKNNDPHD